MVGDMRTMNYLWQLTRAGWQGAASARQETNPARLAPPSMSATCASAAIGAAAGILAAQLAGKRQRASAVAIGGTVGSIVGVGASAAWSARHVSRAAARAALCRVNALRDAHWLELNPIDYA
jgi:hypothetical protein